MTSTRSMSIMLAAALVPVLAGCGSYGTGQSAYDAGNYDAAERRWEAASRLGDTEARYALARMLAEGDGVEADPFRAARLYESLAEGGDPWAALELAALLSTPDSPARDDAAAARWYRVAAEKDIEWAQIELGRMIRDGRVAGASPAEAVSLFRAAAEVGNATGQYELGLALRDGIGVPADGEAALDWFERASRQGHVGSLLAAADLRQGGGAGVAADPWRATGILRRAAEQGSTLAMLRLGGAVSGPEPAPPTTRAGSGEAGRAAGSVPVVELDPEERDLLAADAGAQLPVDEAEQIIWLRRAATAAIAEERWDIVGLTARRLDELGREEETYALWLPLAEAGNPEVQHVIAGRLADGIGVEADPVAATEWFRLAAEQEVPWAMYDYAGRLADGEGTDRNRRAAIEWYTRAGNAGIDAAWTAIADLGTGSDGIPRGRALAALQRAAASGDADSAYRMYELVSAGDIPGDDDDAVRWLRTAAFAGYTQAQADLGRRMLAGDGVEADADRALDFLERAARSGSVDAQFNLAVALYRGVAIQADPEGAFLWFDMAARGGDGEATVWRNRLATEFGPEKTEALIAESDQLARTAVRPAAR